ncbi:MAG: 4Fe-4S binding protein [Methanomassiliicoccales archaeon]|jgi:epoxyqueuosine reductase QueG
MVDLGRFFQENAIDDFSVISRGSLSNEERSTIENILPSFKSVIVFGKEIPPAIFNLSPKAKSDKMGQGLRHLDGTSNKLCGLLLDEGHRSVATPSFLPVRIDEGQIKGVISLKHAAVKAGMGSLGDNTLLISDRFGNRLSLSALVTEADIPPLRRVSTSACSHCSKCIDSCPAGAISSKGVDSVKCTNFTYQVPWAVRPVVKFMAKHGIARSYLESYINNLDYIEKACSDCMTVCPFFGEKRQL